VGQRESPVADLVRPSRAFWSGKRVLVLGHTGFKGVWLSLYLRKLGAEVSGLSLAAEPSSLFVETGLDRLVTSRHADIRDLQAVKDSVRELQPELIFHLAAQALVLRSYQDPIETYATNVMGTVHVLAAACAVSSVRGLVVVTSDKCYENREWLWAYREDEPMGGSDPYSSSKACAELVTNAWRSSYAHRDGSIGIASARVGQSFATPSALDDYNSDCRRRAMRQRDMNRRRAKFRESRCRSPVQSKLWCAVGPGEHLDVAPTDPSGELIPR